MDSKEIDLEFSIKSLAPEHACSDCVVVGVFEDGKLSAAAKDIDRASKTYLSGIVRGGDMDGRSGTSLLLYKVPNIAAERVLLIGLGKEDAFGEKAYRAAISSAVRSLRDTGAAEGVIYLCDLAVGKRDSAWKAEQAAIMAHEAFYRFDQLKSKAAESKRPLKHITLGVSGAKELTLAKTGLQ